MFCPNHPTRRIKAKGVCNSCYDHLLKASNSEYKARQIESSAKWQKLNQDKLRIAYEKRKAKELLDPGHKLKRRNRSLKKAYGISNEDYKKILTYQKSVCAICLVPPKASKYLHIDHDHSTGRIRGLLCHQCNWYLGVIDSDKIETLVRLNTYGSVNLPWHDEVYSKQGLNE